MLDWVRDRPVHTFAAVAGAFLVFYAIYVYLQIFHPGILRGDFFDQPLQAKSPPARSAPISSAPPPPDASLQTRAMDTPAPALAEMPAARQEPAVGESAPTPPAPPAAAPSPRKPAREARSQPVDSEGEGPVRKARTPPARAEPAQGASVSTAMVEPPALDDNVAVRTPEREPQAMPSLMQAWNALQQGRYEDAERLYQAAGELDGDNVDVMLGLAAIAVQRGHTDQAARHYANALEREPRNATAQGGLISIIGQADPQMSETRLKQLISNEPSGFLYFGLGNLYARQNLWAQAQQAYYQAYQLQPDHPDYAYNLAIGLEHLGQPKIALNYYRRALELSLQRGHASFDQGRVQERIGQLTARVGSD
jgi:Flp pilus assembly protein TadD